MTTPTAEQAPEVLASAPRHLPLGRTLAGAYGFVFNNVVGFLVLAGVPWLGISIAGLFTASAKPDAYVLMVVAFFPWLARRLASMPAPAVLLHTPDVVSFLLHIFFVSAFALAWHRYVLTGSVTSGVGALRLLFRDLRFFAYCLFVLLAIPLLVSGGLGLFVLSYGIAAGVGFGFALLSLLLWKVARRPVGAFLALFLIAAGAVIFHEGMPESLRSFFLVAVIFVAATPLARLLLAFPAIAMGEPGALPLTAWHRSRGHDAKLCLGLIGCAAPFEAARLGALFLLTAYAGHAGRAAAHSAAIALMPLSNVWFLLEIAVASSFLCIAYRQLGGSETPASPDEVLAAEGLPSA
jgi:hypothetical protein